MTQAALDVFAALQALYAQDGVYGNLTQLAHATQTADLARAGGEDDETVVAGLFVVNYSMLLHAIDKLQI